MKGFFRRVISAIVQAPLLGISQASVLPQNLSGTVNIRKPDEVFLAGSFAASNGIVLPYRYFLPDGYENSTATYPVFFYLHGDGSRGSDNVTQLTTIGAALNTAVLNSGHNCIMIAPQCPSGTSWIPKNCYPGSAAFASSFAAGTRFDCDYLDASVELLKYFISTYRVDTSRIYMTGSSKGAGASWTLAAYYPNAFAAVVPMAGTGSTGGDMAFVNNYIDIPIWAFHGDADAVLNVAGTRGIVAAVQAAGGTKIRYTEIAGGTHNIWPDAAKTEGLIDWIFTQKNGHYDFQ